MEPGWIVLLFSLFVQMFFTVLASRPRLRLGVWARNSSHPACSPACACTSAAQLVAPLPSNAVRGFLVEAIQSLTEKPGVKYAVWGTFALNIFYFWYSLATVDAAPACSGVSVPPPARRRAPSSTEIAPPHSSLHLRRAQVYDRGADAHGPRPRNPVPSRVRHYVRGQAGHVPSGAQCWLGYPNLHSSMTLTLTQTLNQPHPNPNSNLTLTLTLTLTRSATRSSAAPRSSSGSCCGGWSTFRASCTRAAPCTRRRAARPRAACRWGCPSASPPSRSRASRLAGTFTAGVLNFLQTTFFFPPQQTNTSVSGTLRLITIVSTAPPAHFSIPRAHLSL